MRLKSLALSLTLLTTLTLGLTACSLVESDGNSGDAGDAKVAGLALSTQVNAEGQPVNARNFFAPTDTEIRATVVMDGVEAGQNVEGRWYQLGTADAGADGQEISKSDFDLDAGSIQNGQTVVTFFLRSSQGFPEDSWLLRVFVDGEQIRTSGFIITRAAQAPSAPPASNPSPSSSPTRTP